MYNDSALNVLATNNNSITNNNKLTTRISTSHRQNMYITSQSVKNYLK